MKDFESKEFRSYLNKNCITDLDEQIDIKNIQLAEIEIDKDILLAVHRC